jgi:chemotaxis protein methyltransferase CheR
VNTPVKLVDENDGAQGGGSPFVREFSYTRDDFARIREIIHVQAGIALSPIKREMAYSRIARRLRALGLTSFKTYLDHLQSDASEMESFVNAMTTNLTSFFREEHHFERLLDQMQASHARPFRIWCAASATGEEAYSLAMTACEAFGTDTPPVSILASDIDTHVLNTARAGIYPVERVEKLSQERLRNFFLRGVGQRSGYARVRPALQALVDFQRINLLDSPWPMSDVFDAIFCRNVMIYFDKETQRQLLQRFQGRLAAHGLFYAGHSESFLQATDLFRSCGRTIYEHAR